MRELLSTNDPVTLSFIEAMLKEAGIAHMIADSHMSVMEGSLNMLPRRVLVEEDEYQRAWQLARDAGLGSHLTTG